MSIQQVVAKPSDLPVALVPRATAPLPSLPWNLPSLRFARSLGRIPVAVLSRCYSFGATRVTSLFRRFVPALFPTKTESFICAISTLIARANAPVSGDTKNRQKLARECGQALETLGLTIRRFFDKWALEQFQHVDERRQFASWLDHRLHQILESNISSSAKKAMLESALMDTTQMLATARRRVTDDVANGRLIRLGIPASGVRIAKITPLGEETHRQYDQPGQIPLRIYFTNGTSIVYKPRSLLTESLICDREAGLLARPEIGWGTYTVVCRTDTAVGGGDYGYVEFLTQTQEGNTITSPEQLAEYVKKLHILDRLARSLGLTDLHCGNILTRGQIPYLIDLEVADPAQDPPPEPGIFDGSGFPAAYEFTVQGASAPSRIWFGPDMQARIPGRLDFRRMDAEAYAALGVDVAALRAVPVVLPQEPIRTIRERLGRALVRAVPVVTQELLAWQRTTDWLDPAAMERQREFIAREIEKEFSVRLNDESNQALLRALRRDAENGDLPIFHLLRGTLYCSGIPIIRIPTTPGEVPGVLTQEDAVAPPPAQGVAPSPAPAVAVHA